MRRRCGRMLRRACPTTWCRRRSCCWTGLPLTPNGKLDRRALPAPDLTPVSVRRAPRSAAGGDPVRPVRRGAGGRAGRHRRQLLRARRAFAAGDAADQPHPLHPGRRDRDPQPVRGARPWRRWPNVSTRRRRRARLWFRLCARPRFRCRLRSGGCGSSTGWRGPSAHLHDPDGGAAHGRARHCGAGSRARRPGGAAREPAHHLPRYARRPAPADPGCGRGAAASLR